MSVSTMAADDLATLAEHIGQLVEHHHHAEKYYVWNRSRHKVWKHPDISIDHVD